MTIKKNLLIVDDEAFYARSLATGLKKEFQRRIIAANLDDAIEVLNNETIDVALLDVRLDEGDEENTDGLKILQWLNENKPAVKAYVMTSYTEKGYKREAMEMGAGYFFEKPIDILEMRRILMETTE